MHISSVSCPLPRNNPLLHFVFSSYTPSTPLLYGIYISLCYVCAQNKEVDSNKLRERLTSIWHQFVTTGLRYRSIFFIDCSFNDNNIYRSVDSTNKEVVICCALGCCDRILCTLCKLFEFCTSMVFSRCDLYIQ